MWKTEKSHTQSHMYDNDTQQETETVEIWIIDKKSNIAHTPIFIHLSTSSSLGTFCVLPLFCCASYIDRYTSTYIYIEYIESNGAHIQTGTYWILFLLLFIAYHWSQLLEKLLVYFSWLCSPARSFARSRTFSQSRSLIFVCIYVFCGICLSVCVNARDKCG